jgi:hypothetical protein
MPLAGFEPTIPVFKRAKTFHALDRAATVTGRGFAYCCPIIYFKFEDIRFRWFNVLFPRRFMEKQVWFIYEGCEYCIMSDLC